MGLKKENAERFDREVIAIAVELGAVIHEERTRIFQEDVYVIETKAGPMTINPSTNPSRAKQGGIFTVFCKFEDVDRANKLLGVTIHLNPYSGKYNLHDWGGDGDVDYALRLFRQHLAPVLEAS